MAQDLPVPNGKTRRGLTRVAADATLRSLAAASQGRAYFSQLPARLNFAVGPLDITGSKTMEDFKRRVAELADELYASKITHDQFQDAIPLEALDDPQVDETVDMIMHEPHVGWFLGVSKEQGQKNRAEILQRIEALRHRRTEPAA